MVLARRRLIELLTIALLAGGVVLFVSVCIRGDIGRGPDVSLIERQGCLALRYWDRGRTGASMWIEADFYNSTPDRRRAVYEDTLYDYNAYLYDHFLRRFPGRDAAEYHRAFEECKDYIRWRDSG